MIFVVSLFLFASIALAYNVEYIGIVVKINKDLSSNVNVTITPQEPLKQFQWTLFYRIHDLEYSASFPIQCKAKVTDISSITCDLQQNESLRSFTLSFKTESFVKRVNTTFYSYFSDFIFPFKVDNLVTMVKLPESYSFSDTNKIIPKPQKIGSDGKRIFAYWNYGNLDKNSALRISFFFVAPEVKKGVPYLLILLVFILVFVVFALVFYLFYYRKRQFRLALSVIDKDEKKVLEILDNFEKPVNQKKIVELTGFSKAKVSRIINSLHERRIVDVERRGRINLVKLKPLYRGISRK